MGNVILGISVRFWRYMVSPDTFARLKVCHPRQKAEVTGIQYVFTLIVSV